MTLLRAVVGVFVAPAEPDPPLAVATRDQAPLAVATPGDPAEAPRGPAPDPEASWPASCEPTPPSAAAAGSRPPAVGVVAGSDDAAVLGAAVAMVLARERRQSPALVAVWTGMEARAPTLPAPARPGTRRLSARLVAAGHAARAAGRLVIVSLPVDEAAAAASAGAIERLTAEPLVLVVGGPRGAPFHRLLGERDRVLVVTRPGADPDLVGLAASELPLAPAAVASCAVAPGAGARLLARAGLWLAPSLRAGLRSPLEGWA